MSWQLISTPRKKFINLIYNLKLPHCIYLTFSSPNNIKKNGEVYNNKAEKKLTLNEVSKLSKTTVEFINFLNSSIFIEYLQKITGIKEVLIPDPYLIGGGLHELRNEGFLNIHSDV